MTVEEELLSEILENLTEEGIKLVDKFAIPIRVAARYAGVPMGIGMAREIVISLMAVFGLEVFEKAYLNDPNPSTHHLKPKVARCPFCFMRNNVDEQKIVVFDDSRYVIRCSLCGKDFNVSRK